MAPFYVAAGFGLYITRRTELEAWDIELAFRRLQQRLDSPRQDARTVASAIALLALGLCAVPDNGAAADLSSTEAKALIEEILADDAFGEPKTVVHWRLKDPSKTEPDGETFEFAWLNKLIDWLAGDIVWLAGIFKGLIWIGAGVLIATAAWLIWRQSRWYERHGGRIKSQHSKEAPVELFGMNLADQGLAGDISSQIEYLLLDGKKREALSLLYRATLYRLLHERGVEINSGHTERECVRIVDRERPTDESTFFTRLMRTWLRLAYGHQAPTSEAIASLSQEWQQLFVLHRSSASD
jgi:hypothetical protein